jgi:hypothetical protein
LRRLESQGTGLIARAKVSSSQAVKKASLFVLPGFVATHVLEKATQ